ncbi:MAG: PEP-CTERM sorting domain-containing protein [Nitrospirae bacterium]|nr:PEP-CTERM sorting domain-containing protein [Nitrospirota bacterium]
MKSIKSLYFIICFLITICCVNNLHAVEYTDFSDLSAFTLNGASSTIHNENPIFYNGQNILRLTNSTGTGGISGSAFLTTPVVLEPNDSFNTFFQFQITQSSGIGDSDGIGGDGLMFVMQTESATALGTGGGYLGYGHGQPSEPSSILPSIGIEFDTFYNPSPQNGDPIFDSNGNHAGIDINGSLVSLASAQVSNRLNNGAIWNAWIDYNGTSDLLEVRVSEASIRPTDPLLTYTIDINSVLGSSGIYAGFTAGITSATNTHDIRTWTFNTSTTVVPEPISSILFIAGGALLVGRGYLGKKRRHNNQMHVNECHMRLFR